jgi:hypothetical protein
MRKHGLPALITAGVCFFTALPALTAAPAAALSFADPAHYGLGAMPADLASADLNGDRHLDIAASAGRGMSILLGTARGRFAPARRIPLSSRPGAIALADLDRDGTWDIVTANGDSTVGVLLGDGAGSFVLKGVFPTGRFPSDIVVGDLTGDGVPDVATADGDGLSLLTGDGTGDLLPPRHLPVGEGCRRLVAGDLDLDGDLDLVCTRNSFEDYSGAGVLLADGAGGFAPLVTYGTRLEPGDLALCDLNGDGKPDLVATDHLEGDAEVTAFLGDGTGILAGAGRTMLSHELDASGLAVGDLNGDGRADVATAGRRPGYVTGSDGHWVKVPPGPPRIYVVLARASGGVFLKPRSFLAGRLPGEMVVADFNDDGRPDLATTDTRARSVSVRLNERPPR